VSDPPQDKLESIRSLFPGRALFLVEAMDAEEQAMSFVMTAPERGEYRLFVEQIFKAREQKNDVDKIWATRAAVENAALAQIRWPSREECMEAFQKRPAMIDGFAEELQKAAGEQIEFRSKKF
jgi:hypothetical protein